KITAQQRAERDRKQVRQAERERAETQRQQAKTAANARAILKKATKAEPCNPYLQRKQVQATGTLYEIDADTAATVLNYTPKASGQPLAGRLLVVPVKRAGKLTTLELIDGESRKVALAGRGTKTGAYWATAATNGACRMVIGEGVSTAST